MKVRPGKSVFSGPAWLVVEDVPLPLALPFAYFPITSTYSSGFIMPTYGDEFSRGFYLRDGGYYFAISDYMDLKLTGEIFTKGSWGIGAQTTYKKRYKYAGNFYINYQVTKDGEENMPDYSVEKNFLRQCELRHTILRKKQPHVALQPHLLFTEHTHFICFLFAQFPQDRTFPFQFLQHLAEHARLHHCAHPALHVVVPFHLLSLQTQGSSGKGTLV